MKASTALPASRAERPLFAATLLMKSCFVKAFLLVWMPVGQTLAKKANNGIGYRSTMRFCGDFPQFRPPKQRVQPHGRPREGVDAAPLAVDDANRVGDTQSGLTERLDGLDRRPARSDDVHDQADAVAVGGAP